MARGPPRTVRQRQRPRAHDGPARRRRRVDQPVPRPESAQKSCRGMERERPELVELDRSNTAGASAGSTGNGVNGPNGRAKRVRRRRGMGCAGRQRENPAGHGCRRGDDAKQHIGRIVEACAKASRSEDEFIRRVRSEGFSIDPSLRKGTAKDSFTDSPDQVVGYRITWRSRDGWTERFNASDLGDDMRLKELRDDWAHDARSRESLAVQEWRAAWRTARRSSPTAWKDTREPLHA